METAYFLLDQEDKTVVGNQPITDPEVVVEVLGQFSEVMEALKETDWLDSQLPPIEDSPIFKKAKTGERARALARCSRARKICLTVAVAGTVAAGAAAAFIPVFGWAALAFGAIGAGGGAGAAKCENDYEGCVEGARKLPV